MLLNSFSYALEGHEADPHFEWVEGNEVAVCENGIFIDTNKGMMQLNVVEYDEKNDRYLVKCSCLEKPYLYGAEALGMPYKNMSAE